MWQCPACEEEIPHPVGEYLPQPHVRYRCIFCYIDLVFDTDYSRFKLAPLINASAKRRSKRSRKARRQRRK